MPFRISRHCLFMLAVTLMLTAFTIPSSFARDIRLQKWPADTPVPALQLKDIAGKEWSLPSLRGKVVLLNFWATWCAPCIDELPILNELANAEFHKGNLVVLGVNFKEAASTVQRFSSEHPMTYPVLMDKSGEYFRKWTNGILPTTVLIDRHGRPRWRITGELDRSDPGLQQAVEKLLQEQSTDRAKRRATVR